MASAAARSRSIYDDLRLADRRQLVTGVELDSVRPGAPLPQKQSRRSIAKFLARTSTQFVGSGNAKDTLNRAKSKIKSRFSSLKAAAGTGSSARYAVVIFILLASLAALVIGLLHFIFQYIEFPRDAKINDNDETTDIYDTETRHTLTYIINGPLSPFIFLAFGSYYASVTLPLSSVLVPIGTYTTRQTVYLFGVTAVAFFFGVYHWVLEERLGNEAHELHLDLVEGVPVSMESDVTYLVSWYTSPLKSYILGTNAYLTIVLWFMWFPTFFSFAASSSTRRQYAEARKQFKEDSDDDSTTSFLAIFYVILLAVGLCFLASHLVLVILAVFSNTLNPNHTYWSNLRLNVHYNLAVFILGWIMYYYASGDHWRSEKPTSRGFHIFFMVIALLVSLTATVSGSLGVADLYTQCRLNPVGGIIEGEDNSVLRMNTCVLQEYECESSCPALIEDIECENIACTDLCYWNRANAIGLMAVIGLISVALAVDIFSECLGSSTSEGADYASSYLTTSSSFFHSSSSSSSSSSTKAKYSGSDESHSDAEGSSRLDRARSLFHEHNRSLSARRKTGDYTAAKKTHRMTTRSDDNTLRKAKKSMFHDIALK